MLSLSDSAQVNCWIERLHRLQRTPWIVYGSTLGAILIATFVRWALGSFVHDRIPFTTYYPAIVLATLLGGFWLGMLASMLSAVVAWWMFMSAPWGVALDAAQLTSLITFILVCLLLVGTVTALNSAIDLLLVEVGQRQKTHLALGQLRAVSETSEDAIVMKDLNGVITSWNKGAERVFGYAADEVIGKPVSLLIPADRYDEEPSILVRIRKGQRVEPYETVRRRKDGSLIDISLTVSPLADATGTVVGASKIARDITDKKRAEARQQLLLREMAHRVKNTFMLVNGIVALSARYAEPQNLARDIQARLAALARAHDLTRVTPLPHESELANSMSFRALVGAIFTPYLDSSPSGHSDRLTFRGPDVLVQHPAITSVALVLYELATNAVKCGSLSVPTGSVQISLAVVKEKFEVEWKELGGPKLTEKPNHEGFGTNLVRRIIADQFGGEVFYDWNYEGLIVRLTVPSNRVIDVTED